MNHITNTTTSNVATDLPKITQVRPGLYEAFDQNGVRFIIAKAQNGKWHLESSSEFHGEFKTLKAARYVALGY